MENEREQEKDLPWLYWLGSQFARAQKDEGKAAFRVWYGEEYI